ncbi:MAG: DUF3459 domain-containing protein [Candidatus Cloacimonetes bacterium]|nr:DUF3459 domain-containing protein [Candidatus Cloacimonadota bacterium]
MKKIILILFILALMPIIARAELHQLGETFWWNDTVFYEIFVRSFADSDGDGIGDLQGLINKMDYLNDGDPKTTSDLGITGIWLMPICQSPSYHGYDVTDYKTIEDDYGTNKDFLQLMEECHKRGIKVIVDFVMNHCSNQHPWFEKAKAGDIYFRNWFRWKRSKPDYLGPWGQPVWHEADDDYYYGLFWSGMPDLNYETKAVRNEMLSLTKFWLQKMKVDGFRCDAAKHIFEEGEILENVPRTFEWWRQFNDYYKKLNPDALAVGEAWDSSDMVVKYLDHRFDFCFEFDLANTIIFAVNNSSVSELKDKLQEVIVTYPYHQYGTFLTNHDQNRVMNQLAFDIEKAKFAAELYLGLPGIPFIYYGEEIGMTGSKPDPNIRTPMQWNSDEFGGFSKTEPWHKVNENYKDFNVKKEQKHENSLWQVYREMISLRSEHPALRKGTMQILDCEEENVLVMLRIFENDIVLMVYNFGKTTEALQVAAKHTNLQKGDYQIFEGDSNSAFRNIAVNNDGNLRLSLPGISKYKRRFYVLEN